MLNFLQSTRHISIILTVVALGLWSYSITQATYNVGLLGLIHGLPIAFFVALGFLTIASAILWLSPEDHSKLLFVQLFFLMTSLWLTPLITGGTQTFASAHYWYTGYSEYIVREGHFNQYIHLFHNWPGAIMLFAMLSMILGLPGPYALVIDPSINAFIIQWIVLLFAYLFLKNILPENQKNLCWAGVWIFGLGFWMGTGAYLGSSTVGYILLLIVLVLLTKKSSLPQNLRTSERRLLTILTLACVTITHLLSSFVTFVAVAMLRITKRINSTTLVTFGAVVLLAWLMYEATAFFEGNVPRFIEQALRLDIILEKGVVERVAGSEMRQAVSMCRIVLSVLFLAIGFLGFIFSRRAKKSIYSDNTAVAIAFAFLAVGAILSYGGGKEVPERTYHFLLPVLAYFGVKLLSRKSTAIVLCTLLLVALPLRFVSQYGAEVYEHLPPSRIAASHFFADHTTEGEVVGIGGFERIEHYKKAYFGRLGGDMPLLPEPKITPQYVGIGSSIRGRLYYLYNDTCTVDYIQDLVEHSSDYNSIYVNNDVSLYIRE